MTKNNKKDRIGRAVGIMKKFLPVNVSIRTIVQDKLAISQGFCNDSIPIIL